MTGLLDDDKQAVASMVNILPYLIVILKFPAQEKMTLRVLVSPMEVNGHILPA